MSWQFPPLTIALAANAIFATLLMLVAWRHRRTGVGQAFALFMFSAWIWIFVRALEAIVVETWAKIFWAKVEYLGISTSGVFWLIFALEYSQDAYRLTWRNLVLLGIVPAITIGVAWTNDWHGWLWSRITPNPDNPGVLIYTHGWWFWIATFYNYSVIIAGALRLMVGMWGGSRVYRFQARALLIGLVFPLLGNLIYLAGLSPVRGLDTTQFGFTLAGVFYGLSVFRYRLFDLVPVARDVLIENMQDGVVVLDAGSRIVDINLAAQRLCWPKPASPIGQPIGAVLTAWPELMARCWDAPEAQAELQVGDDPPRFMDVRISPLLDRRGRLTGRLIVLRDVTERRQAESALQELNADLERQVSDRTVQLQATIHDLENEIAERRRVEKALRQTEQNLVQRVTDQSRKLAALYDVILAGGQAPDTKDMLERSLDRVVFVMGGEAAYIHQWDEDASSLRMVVQRGLPAEAQIQVQTQSLPAWWLFHDDVPWIVSNLSAGSDLPDSVRLSGFGAFLGAPIHLRGQAVGALSVFWSQPRQFSVEDIALFSAIADQIGIIMENFRLRQSAEQAAAQQERQRLARDLHDSVTQSLHSLILSAETASNRLRLGKLELLDASLFQLAEGARQALKEMRLLLYELRLAPLEQPDLVEALQTRLETVEQRAGVAAQLFVENTASWPRLWEAELYSIAMEALNNALKHAQATQVKVCLRGDQNWVELEVADNGRGFDVKRQRTSGMGLCNMAERAEQLGGSLVVDSEPERGTRVRLLVGTRGSS